MFILGSFTEAPDEVLLRIIQITCDAQNSKDIPSGFQSPSAYAGYEITKYLWKLGAIKVVKEEPKKQMTLDEFMSGHSDGKHGMDKDI